MVIFQLKLVKICHFSHKKFEKFAHFPRKFIKISHFSPHWWMLHQTPPRNPETALPIFASGKNGQWPFLDFSGGFDNILEGVMDIYNLIAIHLQKFLPLYLSIRLQTLPLYLSIDRKLSLSLINHNGTHHTLTFRRVSR